MRDDTGPMRGSACDALCCVVRFVSSQRRRTSVRCRNANAIMAAATNRCADASLFVVLAQLSGRCARAVASHRRGVRTHDRFHARADAAMVPRAMPCDARRHAARRHHGARRRTRARSRKPMFMRISSRWPVSRKCVGGGVAMVATVVSYRARTQCAAVARSGPATRGRIMRTHVDGTSSTVWKSRSMSVSKVLRSQCVREVDRFDLARKFFCTFFLTSSSKRIMIRLDKSLTSLHRRVVSQQASRSNDEAMLRCR
ncbi:hypothetical protein EV147_0082 [Cupriavidus agavae]|uniref:Uncharacterized protein n=1 Tax=Cupriavidus agavae TaxID=1001822 RepID=A0A4Q7S3N9_9BURK|nr:hypothetical protein EV147_0082 [Cupriavidus agavae]